MNRTRPPEARNHPERGGTALLEAPPVDLSVVAPVRDEESNLTPLYECIRDALPDTLMVVLPILARPRLAPASPPRRGAREPPRGMR